MDTKSVPSAKAKADDDRVLLRIENRLLKEELIKRGCDAELREVMQKMDRVQEVLRQH